MVLGLALHVVKRSWAQTGVAVVLAVGTLGLSLLDRFMRLIALTVIKR